MHLFYEPVVQPLIQLLNAQVIVDIGTDQGVDSALLGATCAADGRVLHSLPSVVQSASYRSLRSPFSDTWQEIEQITDPVDLALFNGESDRGAVVFQLQQLRRHSERLGHRFPIVVVHDRAVSRAGLSSTVSEFCANTHAEVGYELVPGNQELAVLFAEQHKRESAPLASFISGLSRLSPNVGAHVVNQQAESLRRRFEYLEAATKLARLEYEAGLAAMGGQLLAAPGDMERDELLAERDAWRNYALALRGTPKRSVSVLQQVSPQVLPGATVVPALSAPKLERESEPSAETTVVAEPIAAPAAKVAVLAAEVIICIYNALPEVKACLAALLEHDDADTQLLIVDDASNQSTAAYLGAWCREHAALARLLTHSENLGYTAAVNTGLRASRAQSVVLLNSDTQVTKGWLAKLIHCAESDPAIGIVGPLSNAASWQNVPALLDSNGKFAINELPTGHSIESFAQLVEETSALARPTVPFVNGFCFLIRRRVIDKIGLFDMEAFPRGYGEENDYCLRASQAGFKLAIADDVFVFHSKSKSFGHAERTRLSQLGKDALEKKHGANAVKRGVETIKTDFQLQGVRKRLADALGKIQSKAAVEPERILFLLPVSGGGGGVHSVVQEAAAMRRLGIAADVAVRPKHLAKYLEQYEALPDREELFVPVEPAQLVNFAASYSIVVATIFTSMGILRAICDKHAHVTPAYYVQDYEPNFFATGTSEHAEALASYGLIAGTVLFAKTWWLVDTIGSKHDLYVHKVRPSLDRNVYQPGSRALLRPELSRAATNAEQRETDGVDEICHETEPKLEEPTTVVVTAMIRPSTPRRGARRTMQVLGRVQELFGNRVSLQIFGCEPDDLDFEALRNLADCDNHGRLTREGVAALLAQSDVFIDLSDYQAFGRTGLEAMACGCAVINPKEGGADEYCVDGENSLLVDTSHENACFEALASLIREPSLLRRIAAKGQHTARSYSAEQAAESELLVLKAEALKFRGEAKAHLWTAEAIAERQEAIELAVSTQASQAVVLRGKSSVGIAPDTLLTRRVRKLMRDPKRFLKDSKFPLAKQLGNSGVLKASSPPPKKPQPAAKAVHQALVTQVTKPTSETPAKDSRAKKRLAKLLRDPRRFLADSKIPMAKKIAKNDRLWR